MRPRFEPANLPLIAIFVAPPACGLNATLAGLLMGEVKWGGTPSFFFGATFSALLCCFPLGLVSEYIGDLWVGGRYRMARLISLVSFCFLAALIRWIIFTPHLPRKQEYSSVALLLIPIGWSILFLVFTLFARLPKPNY